MVAHAIAKKKELKNDLNLFYEGDMISLIGSYYQKLFCLSNSILEKN
jgi:hypothetical protein